ncbi:hypothetical protein EVAR_55449_1 [Eumeta japonica]|uniref:Uncharacterized protein n=1 Tax=Eumeta variegata TaxID=151549 RepID=A0A4C1Y6E5_EUMVA|nr:hypothetical protein EVAR_55449_1 [Eumeta japonica]
MSSQAISVDDVYALPPPFRFRMKGLELPTPARWRAGVLTTVVTVVMTMTATDGLAVRMNYVDLSRKLNNYSPMVIIQPGDVWLQGDRPPGHRRSRCL